MSISSRTEKRKKKGGVGYKIVCATEPTTAHSHKLIKERRRQRYKNGKQWYKPYFNLHGLLSAYNMQLFKFFIKPFK